MGIAFYALGSSVVVPPLAAIGGRVPLPLLERDGLAPRNLLFCAFNRHYVERNLRDRLLDITRRVVEGGAAPIRYLDASFPFATPLPLLPHLSHGSGRAVDLAMPLLDPETGESIDGGGSPIGYWGYVAMAPGESHAAPARLLDLRWDLELLQPMLGDTRLDEGRLAALVRAAARQNSMVRIVVEPRIEARLVPHLDTASLAILRYQGDHAARHDDHVHLGFSER